MDLNNWGTAIDALLKGGMDRTAAANQARQQMENAYRQKNNMIDQAKLEGNVKGSIWNTMNDSYSAMRKNLDNSINQLFMPPKPPPPAPRQLTPVEQQLQALQQSGPSNPGDFNSAFDYLRQFGQPQQTQQLAAQSQATQKPSWMGSGGVAPQPFNQGFGQQQPQQQMQPQQQPQQSMQAPLGGMGQPQNPGFAQRPADMFNFGPMYGGGYGMNPYASMFGPQNSMMGYGMMGGYGMNPRQMMMGGGQQMQPQQQRGGGLPQGFRDWAIKNNIGRPQNAQAFQNIYNQYQQQQQQTPMF